MEDMVKGYLIGTCLTHIILICGFFLFELMKYLANKWKKPTKPAPELVEEARHTFSFCPPFPASFWLTVELVKLERERREEEIRIEKIADAVARKLFKGQGENK